VEVALMQRHAVRQPPTRTRPALANPRHHEPITRPHQNTKPAATPTTAEPIRIWLL
jgi:hypothetical protein